MDEEKPLWCVFRVVFLLLGLAKLIGGFLRALRHLRRRSRVFAGDDLKVLKNVIVEPS